MNDQNFKKKYCEAIKAQIPLAVLRGKAEECFTDYMGNNRGESFSASAYDILNDPTSSEYFITQNFDMYISCELEYGFKSSDNAGAKNLVPTLTFGDILMPVKLINKHDPFNSKNIIRNYILLSDSSSGENICELLTEHWGFHFPKLVLSFTSGSVKEFEGHEKLFNTFVTSLYRFCKSTGVWILSNGLHCGVTRLLGRIFEYDLEPDEDCNNSSFKKEVTLIGISDWDKLQNKLLLHGISSEDYMSYYFFPRESNLEASEDEGTLSPFQHVHLLVQGDGPGKQISLRETLQSYLKKGILGPIHYSGLYGSGYDKDDDDKSYRFLSGSQGSLLLPDWEGKHAIPIVKFVLGGDSTSLQQIKACVQSEIPVVIIQQSGELPNCLAEIYKELECLTTRSCNHEPGLSIEEQELLERILNRNAIRSVFDHQDVEDVKQTVKIIMEHRYFLTILNLTNQKSADFKNVIRAIYKPYKSVDCMNIALQTDNVSFLETFLSRDVDVMFVGESRFVDADGLVSLHRENLTQNHQLFELTINDLKDANSNQVLHLVGITVFNLVRYKYCMLYQNNISSLRKKLDDPMMQIWHLFVYTVLSNRRRFAECLLSHTESPVGAALFACKLFRGMHIYAERQMETENAIEFKQSADAFEDLALKILHQMYHENPQWAYICLTNELPYDLGVYITPLSLAADSDSMRFMESECCQTYLQKVWTKNMYLVPGMKVVLPAMVLLPFLPPAIIYFEEFKTPAKHALAGKEKDKRWKLCSGQQPCKTFSSWWWKVKSFYTAPITKCNFSMISYMTFLGVISYFFVARLQPVNAANEIFPSEWLCFSWTLGFVFEEIAQIYSIKDKGPVHTGEDDTRDTSIRTISQNFWLQIYYKLKLYLQSLGNHLDILMIVFYCITTLCRFTLPVESFQMVRILYSFSIIFFFFRTLRYFYVLKVLGPRITAMYMMLKETLLFMLILGVFMISFGVAFQGLLNPQQSPSWIVFSDILWRSYWPMFGHLYIDNEDLAGMGRDVSNNTCMKASVSGEDRNVSCYSFVPSVLLAVYLFISNILLLNLLIAIFGNTLNNIERSSNTHWAFNQYDMIYEYYNKPWLPAPLNIPWHFGQVVWKGICCVVKKSSRQQYLTVDGKVKTKRWHRRNPKEDTQLHDYQQARWQEQFSIQTDGEAEELVSDHFWTSKKVGKNLQHQQQKTVRKLRRNGMFKI